MARWLGADADAENPATCPLSGQVDTVVLTRKFLRENHNTCPLSGQVLPKGGNIKHECGSVRCVSTFLGEKNWSRTKVSELFTMQR